MAGAQPSAGLITALNKMREMSVKDGGVYHQYIPTIDEDTDISKIGSVILDSNLTPVYNEFFDLLKRISFFMIENKRFNNPLSFLEGENMPLGFAGQGVHVNAAKGHAFDVNDFAGILHKFEAETFVEYYNINMDRQYAVSIPRTKIKNAFTSWGDLEAFVNGVVNSLYNGAEIDAYNYTKMLVSSAYLGKRVQVKKVSAVSDEATGKAFIKELRKLNRKFQLPSQDYNAWKLLNGDEAKAITTWSNAEDIGLMITADIEAELNVDVLAYAFNMSKVDAEDFIANRVIVVDNFDVYDDEGNKKFDGSAIQGIIFDRSFFKIKTQDNAMDEIYIPSNRCWQYFYNVNKLYNTSLFANAVVLATQLPPEPYSA